MQNLWKTNTNGKTWKTHGNATDDFAWNCSMIVQCCNWTLGQDMPPHKTWASVAEWQLQWLARARAAASGPSGPLTVADDFQTTFAGHQAAGHPMWHHVAAPHGMMLHSDAFCWLGACRAKRYQEQKLVTRVSMWHVNSGARRKRSLQTTGGLQHLKCSSPFCSLAWWFLFPVGVASNWHSLVPLAPGKIRS